MLNERILIIRDLLAGIAPDITHHYYSNGKKLPYIVWAEASASNNLDADNRVSEQSISGTIDLFTKEEFNPLVDAINSALLESTEIAVGEVTVLYDADLGVIHHTWDWEV